MNFLKNLKNLRLESGMNQTQLANAIGLSRSAIAMYESGQREPDLKTLSTLAEYFNVSVDYLVGKSSAKEKAHSKEIVDGGTIQIAGRDGSFIKRKLTDEQLDIVKRMVEQMPDFKN